VLALACEEPVSDRKFFDSLEEAGTLAKHVAAARADSQSSVVRQVAEGRGAGFGVTTSPSEIESGTLEALRASMSLLQPNAPDEVAAYRAFVLDLAKSLAAAAPGGEKPELKRGLRSLTTLRAGFSPKRHATNPQAASTYAVAYASADEIERTPRVLLRWRGVADVSEEETGASTDPWQGRELSALADRGPVPT
jgi:hypothetical protein